MNCLIIDTNKNARTALKQMISMDNTLTLVGECKDSAEAFEGMLLQKIDIIFLDIEMSGMVGVELVKNLEGQRPMIVFTTTTTDYSVDLHDLNVVDFLTKPIIPLRFLQAVEKARELIKGKVLAVTAKDDEFLFIRDANVVKRLKVNDILYLEALGDHVKIHLVNHFYTIHSTLKSVEQRLPQGIFLKTHRSFIVNVSKIDTMEGRSLIINKNIIPVSDAQRSLVNERMHIL